MKFISHRGNLHGPSPTQENNPLYVEEALKSGFFVEVDVWVGRHWWLGHDRPQYRFPSDWLGRGGFIFHCKNWKALEAMRNVEGYVHYFWHQEDDYTLTSEGYIWVYPGKQVCRNSICVLPEKGIKGDIGHCYGICTDYAWDYREGLIQ